MASNTFGKILKITTWGESHGAQIGVVIDGFPAGIPICVESINQALSARRPGQNGLTSPRNEPDVANIQSGLFEGKSTGAPISITIDNLDVDSSKYEPIKHILRPGHAQYTYLQKYGIYDDKGGGRASARETACRVAAGAVAQTLLDYHNIQVISWLDQVGALPLNHASSMTAMSLAAQPSLNQIQINQSPLFLYDKAVQAEAIAYLESIKQNQDSVGGIVGFCIQNLKAGMGDPVYDKLEARLAFAMMSIPASKGFEIGGGFEVAKMQGSFANDPFCLDERPILNTPDNHNTSPNHTHIKTQTNHAGGILGGISNGMPIYGRVAFKPTSSHQLPTASVNLQGQAEVFQIPEGSRHDPCVAIRAVPVVRAMALLCVADALLLQQVQQFVHHTS